LLHDTSLEDTAAKVNKIKLEDSKAKLALANQECVDRKALIAEKKEEGETLYNALRDQISA